MKGKPSLKEVLKFVDSELRDDPKYYYKQGELDLTALDESIQMQFDIEDDVYDDEDYSFKVFEHLEKREKLFR